MRESTLVSIHETGMGVYGRAPSLCHTVDLIFSRCLVDWLNWDFHSLEFSIVHGIYMDNVPQIHRLAAAVQGPKPRLKGLLCMLDDCQKRQECSEQCISPTLQVKGFLAYLSRLGSAGLSSTFASCPGWILGLLLFEPVL